MWRDYTKLINRYCLILWLIPALTFAAPPVQNNLFVEGQDYIRLPDTVRSNPNVVQLLMSAPHKVQVIFFFSYACHGCELFHTPFEQWAAKQSATPKNKTVVYAYPVSFNAQWAMLARLYYVMQNLNPAGNLNNAVFTAVLKNGIKLWDVEVMKKFFIQHGYTATQFDQAFNSFIVNRQVRRADDLSKAYGIVATPDIIINGPVHSYKIDMVKAGNNIPRMIEIINYLVTRESKLL